MLHLPLDIYRDDLDLNSLSEEKRQEALRYLRAYFDLCSEEYELRRQRHLDKDIWENWEQGILFNLNKKPFKQGWEEISRISTYHPDFFKWLDRKRKSVE